MRNAFKRHRKRLFLLFSVVLGLPLAVLEPLLAALGALLCRSWTLLGHSWVTLGRSGAALGRLLAALGALLGAPGTLLEALGALLRRSCGALGALLRRSWALLGRSWAALGRSWDVLGALRAAPGPPRAILARFWTLRGSILDLPRVNFFDLGYSIALLDWKSNNDEPTTAPTLSLSKLLSSLRLIRSAFI